MAVGKGARRLFQLRRAHVVGRRIDEIAREIYAFHNSAEICTVDVPRQLQPELFAVLLVITGKTITAEREGKRSEPRIVWDVGKTVIARRKDSAERSRAERIFARVVVCFDAEEDAADRTVF